MRRVNTFAFFTLGKNLRPIENLDEGHLHVRTCSFHTYYGTPVKRIKGARLGQTRLFFDRMGSCLADNAFNWMMSRCTSYNVAVTANRVPPTVTYSGIISTKKWSANCDWRSTKTSPSGTSVSMRRLSMPAQHREARPRGRPRLSDNVANEEVKGQGGLGLWGKYRASPSLASLTLGTL